MPKEIIRGGKRYRVEAVLFGDPDDCEISDADVDAIEEADLLNEEALAMEAEANGED